MILNLLLSSYLLNHDYRDMMKTTVFSNGGKKNGSHSRHRRFCNGSIFDNVQGAKRYKCTNFMLLWKSEHIFHRSAGLWRKTKIMNENIGRLNIVTVRSHNPICLSYIQKWSMWCFSAICVLLWTKVVLPMMKLFSLEVYFLLSYLMLISPAFKKGKCFIAKSMCANFIYIHTGRLY